ncbi:pantoate--beta-alanine ligase [Thermoflexus sp.]|uniref:pantoate--beta-alanine ligase n=1 Tax=Thermoflexus sp. TaxID=1969742 RepID=UPI0025DECF7F|nr:pantoate--beta-alanine ligase [Thermoflexus sp.]MDW8179952.1 pantoate--beta-alanine ligase [Anaerolineae bacterium]MCS6963919.1 pantoate--beta-alanine ligase [Thermoflexus sp.]MCS7350501.1 pantoate--beta-alanine ligase [Thermoflexus sp.]MCX7690326.1 pantoate--beta-alanine ligase [Thermoflexus sp.]MDW8184448.1 pantoate--beta-alanine ligase [Anaerolineae bacterium]
MQVVRTIAEARAIRRALPGPWGFVPTMGYLHEGHLSLVRRARAENDRVAVSIFVNPTQFGPHEDYNRYPRDLNRDLRLLEPLGVDLVFAPPVEEMYPPGFQTWVIVEEVSRPLEGAARPGHFRGVATVVVKLLNIVQPDRAYFGQKDAQQAVVIRRMVQDLNIPVEIVVCPTVREPDGLAMSSRNTYLNPEERRAATVLFRALQAAKARYEQGERDAERLREVMREVIRAEPLARPDYVSVADPETLQELSWVEDRALLSLAVYIGKTRLIDNILLPE